MLVHEVSDLVQKTGLWHEIARLGMTREFIVLHENFYGRILMELDLIERRAPGAAREVQVLKARVVSLSRAEKPAKPHAA